MFVANADRRQVKCRRAVGALLRIER